MKSLATTAEASSDAPHGHTAPGSHLSHPSHATQAGPTKVACACGGGCPRCQGNVGNVGNVVSRSALSGSLTTAHGPECAAPAPSGTEALASRPAESLPPSVRADGERRFGADLSGARIHVGPEANRLTRAVNARAFTLGQDIVFGPGQFAPESSVGRELIWHELGHLTESRRRSNVALRAPLYDMTSYTVSPPTKGHTAATMRTELDKKIKNGDITKADIVGVTPGSTSEMYLENILWQLGTQAHWDRVMKLQTDVDAPINGVNQPGLVTVTIDAAGAAKAELVQSGALAAVPMPLSKTDAITTLQTDFQSVEKGDKEWEQADLNNVIEALKFVPATDRVALKGVALVRYTALQKGRAGEFTAGNTSLAKGATAVTISQRPELRLADGAFAASNRFVGEAGRTMPPSYQAIIHEVGHAVEAQAKRTARDELQASVIKQNVAFQASETAKKKWDEAKAKGESVMAPKAEFEKQIAANTAAATVSATKKTKLEGSQVPATLIAPLETDATTKQTAAVTALAAADKAAAAFDQTTLSDSDPYRTAVKATDKAIDTYAKEAGVKKNADLADDALSPVVDTRKTALGDLKKTSATNAAIATYSAVDVAQDTAIDALRTLAHTRGRTMRLQNFVDVVNTNAITPFTQYARDNWPLKPEEFYAESYTIWATDPNFLKNNYKPIFDFFDTGAYLK